MLSSLQLSGVELLNSTSFSVTSVTGLEAADMRVTSYDKPGEDGGNVSAAFIGQRTITVEGIVLGQGQPSTHEANRQILEAVCAPSRDLLGRVQLRTLQMTTLGGSTYTCQIQVKQLRNPIGRGTSSSFLLTAVAPDPRLYGAAVTSGAITLASGGGFILPVVLPITSTAAVGGSGSASQLGNIPTYPKLTLTGVLTNPYVLNAQSGIAMQLNYSLGVGDTVVIDMSQKTIMLNGTTPLLSAKAAGADWWSLAPGVTTINFSSGSSSDNGTLTVSWSPAYLGL